MSDLSAKRVRRGGGVEFLKAKNGLSRFQAKLRVLRKKFKGLTCRQYKIYNFRAKIKLLQNFVTKFQFYPTLCSAPSLSARVSENIFSVFD